jgi:Protein kinase domain/NACHT domain
MDPLQPGDPGQVGGYRLLGRLGAGGMGQVFLGHSTGGRPVAVKLIRPEHANNGQFRSRFAREVAAAKQVGGFYTALVLDADPDADPPWMATAYIPGPSLRDAVAARGPLSVGAARALGAGLAEGLAAIHACGLAHRDLKPANVILAPDGPRIIDFGLARTVDASVMTETGAVLGTYAYMAPEQVRGESALPASDVFALGCVLAFAVTGHSPFDAESIATIVHRITSEQPNLRELPEGHSLRELISACLAKDLADRPSLGDILAVLSGPGTDDAAPPAAAAGGTAPGPVAGAAEGGTTFAPADEGPAAWPSDDGPTAYSTEQTGRPRGGDGSNGARRGAVVGGARGGAHGGGSPSGPGSGTALDEAAAQLAAAVGAQWRAEEERRRICDPFPLPVRWHPADPHLVDHWANIRRAPPGASPGPLALAGRLERIADVYLRIPSGRLTVLGRAGAGKSVVALRFVLDMIVTRGAADPVPVLFNVGSWNPAGLSLRGWLTGQLEREYPALAAGYSPAGASMAAALVDNDRILPVLDGFDEIPDGLHGAALRGLSATAMGLLLTSRPDEYAAAVAGDGVLSAAACVQLDDLSLDDLADYLPRSSRPDLADGRSKTAWDPVLARLRDQPADPASVMLRQALATPLMVALARAAYSDTLGDDPACLLNTERFASAAAVQDHLLDSFTPAAYQDPPGGRRRWDAARAQRWLGCLAGQLERTGTHDLALWRLGAPSRLGCALIAGAGSFVVFGFAGWLAGGGPVTGSSYALTYALVNGLVFGLASGFSSGLGTRKAPSHAQIQFRGASSAYLRRLVLGAVVGAVFALAVGLGIFGILLSGLACGLALGSQVWLHKPTVIATVPSPAELLRSDRVATLAFGLGVALAFGTVGGLTVGYAGDPLVEIPGQAAGLAVAALMGLAAGALLGGLSYGRAGAIAFALSVTAAGALANGPVHVSGVGLGLSYGITFGCGVAAVTILPRAWGAYVLGRGWLALRGGLPWPFMDFLTDAHRRGVLRQSGGIYQFRHARLQQRLAQTYQPRR